MSIIKDIYKVFKLHYHEKLYNKQVKNKISEANNFKNEKKIATENREPWVKIINIDVDPNDISSGSVELDWNDIFIARLVKAGYKGRNDKAIIDQWFGEICREIANGFYEQEIADPDKRKKLKKSEDE